MSRGQKSSLGRSIDFWKPCLWTTEKLRNTTGRNMTWDVFKAYAVSLAFESSDLWSSHRQMVGQKVMHEPIVLIHLWGRHVDSLINAV